MEKVVIQASMRDTNMSKRIILCAGAAALLAALVTITAYSQHQGRVKASVLLAAKQSQAAKPRHVVAARQTMLRCVSTHRLLIDQCVYHIHGKNVQDQHGHM